MRCDDQGWGNLWAAIERKPISEIDQLFADFETALVSGWRPATR